MGVPWCHELFESIWYYPNVKCSVSGLIDYEWLIRNWDRRTEIGEPFYKKFMYATDSHYGSADGWEAVLRNATFMHDFFTYVGQTFGWGEGQNDYMLHTAGQYGF